MRWLILKYAICFSFSLTLLLRDIKIYPPILKKQVYSMAETYTPREMLDRLVSFPSVSNVSNLPIIDFIDDYLAGHGVKTHRVYDATGTKANLYASIGPDREGASFCQDIRMLSPLKGKTGTVTPGQSRKATGASMAVVRAI